MCYPKYPWDLSLQEIFRTLLYKVTAGLEKVIALLKAEDRTRQPPEVPSRQSICSSNTVLQKIFEGKIEESFSSIHRLPDCEVQETGDAHETLL